jgi:serine protease Do
MSRHHAPSAVSTPDPVRARRCSRAAAPAAWAALIAGALAGGAPAVLPAQTSSGGGGSATARHMREGCTAEEMAMHERAQQFRREIVRTQSSTAHGRGGDSIRIRLVPRQPSPAEERELRALVEAGRSASGMFQVRHGPSGWIGVSISGPSVQWVTPDGQATIRYCAYPEVVSVEPASPARRAGIVAGDTVLAYNGRDVTKTSVALDTLLVPGARVRMSVRREGRTEDRIVTIGRRPDIALVPSTNVPRPPAPPAPASFSITTRAGAVSAAAARGANGGAVPARLPLPIVTSFTLGRDMGTLAGAQVVTVSDELRESLKLDRGLLVLKVAPDSPAYDSGLRAGDVIQTANGQVLTSPAGLARAMQSSEQERTVRLELRREKKKKAVALRW